MRKKKAVTKTNYWLERPLGKSLNPCRPKRSPWRRKISSASERPRYTKSSRWRWQNTTQTEFRAANTSCTRRWPCLTFWAVSLRRCHGKSTKRLNSRTKAMKKLQKANTRTARTSLILCRRTLSRQDRKRCRSWGAKSTAARKTNDAKKLVYWRCWPACRRTSRRNWSLKGYRTHGKTSSGKTR